MKNLVIVMAGDGSLHEDYASDRDFELWVCYWGTDDGVAERFRRGCDRFFRLKGQKWELVRSLGRVAREEGLPAFSGYDYVFLPDDDIAFANASAVSAVFGLAQAIGADIFQPAIANEHYSARWEPTLRVPDAACHATTIVEIMMPGFSGVIFERCVLPLLHIHGHVTAGWGIEPLIGRFAETVLQRPVRTFVLDETAAVHTRPVGAGTSAYSVGADEAFLNPMAFGVIMKELKRFRTRADAGRYTFPPGDDFVKWRTVERHMGRVRGARRIHEAARAKDIPGYFLSLAQRIAARRLKE